MAGGDSFLSHHHWLLLKLALKTGNVSKIKAAFGDQPGCLCSRWGLSHHDNQQEKSLFPQRELPLSPGAPLTSEKGSEFQGDWQAETGWLETSSYTSFDSDRRDRAVQGPPAAQQEGSLEGGAGSVSRMQERGAGGWLEGGEGQEGSTLYFSAAAEGATSSHQESGQAPPQTLGKGSPAQPASPQPATEPFPITMASISPILGPGPARRFRPGAVLPGRPLGGSECGEQQEPVRDLGQPATAGTQRSLSKVGLRPADKPSLTSTPKSESIRGDCSWKERPKTEPSFIM